MCCASLLWCGVKVFTAMHLLAPCASYTSCIDAHMYVAPQIFICVSMVLAEHRYSVPFGEQSLAALIGYVSSLARKMLHDNIVIQCYCERMKHPTHFMFKRLLNSHNVSSFLHNSKYVKFKKKKSTLPPR